MTEFWTILIITYSGALFDGKVSYVATPSQNACEEAMDIMYDALYPKMPDIMIQCIETTTISGSICPMPRTDDLGVDYD